MKIPADASMPIEELTADKSGGLTNDSLVAHAKQYFGGGFCNITALTVPMASNQHTACSMYTQMDANDDAKENRRASDLITACGGSPTVVRGDAFCGRVKDDENADVWERVDFSCSDADPSATWCREARSSGRGPSSSLQNLLQTQMGAGPGKAPPAVISDPNMDPNNANKYGMGGSSAVKELWGCWTQTDEDLEVKLPLPDNVKAKDCSITFGRNKLKASIAGKVQFEGDLFDPIDVDESTYTIQTDDGSRELCVHLSKAHSGTTWPILMKNP